MKQRFSSLDVKRILLFKFAKPDHREQILVDPGFRCHLTNFSRATAAAPSPFVAKLRKYIRTRRVTAVAQVGTDRVLELQFSDGQYRLYIEFYAGGNIVLTDRELNILSVLRIVPEGAGQEELRAGSRYALENRQNHGSTPKLAKERIAAALQKALDKGEKDGSAQSKKRRSGDLLRKALAASMSEVPPVLIDHALRSTGFDPGKPITEVLNNESLMDGLLIALQEAQQLVKRIITDKSSKGYIFAKVRPGSESSLKTDGVSNARLEAEAYENIIYEDFQPFEPLQMVTSEYKIIEFDGFNKAVDEFFSSIEGQKLESRLFEREQNAKRKLDNAKQDHEKRIGGLQQVQELNVRKAQAIEANLQRVQEAIGAVNGLIGQGMDWVEIARLIQIEQARHNQVAETIKLPLKLYENTITLFLAEEAFDDEDSGGDVTDDSASDSEDDTEDRPRKSSAKAQESTDKRLAVDIDLALSAWSNARQFYDQKRTAASKEQKTLQSSAKALKSTERKVHADLTRGLKQEKQILRPVRKQQWFEKFLFFISSEGYLVLGGKDAQQNEILYKRCLKKGDIYVHADLQGAASVIVKNKPGRSGDPIPPSTLSQAGSFVVTTSNAWESKAVMSAWWVHSEEVSKIASTGEYLPTGSFNIQGEKNFLPPAHLLLGFGILFRVDEESLAKHRKHRHHDEKPDGTKIVNSTSSLGVDVTGIERTAEDGMNDTHVHGVADSTDDDEMEAASLSNPEHEEKDKAAAHVESDVESHNPLMSEHARSTMDDQGESSEGHELQSMMNEGQSLKDGQDPVEHDSDGDSSDHQLEEAATSATNNRDISSVRHLSARERRLLRKGQAPVAGAEDVFDPDGDVTASFETDSARLPADEKPGAASGKPQVRGKHGKRNKLKTKYADQDEEDRALAMRLLGSTASQKATDDAAAKAARDDQLAAQKQRRRQQHITAAQKGKEEEEIRRVTLDGLETINQTETESLEDIEAYVGTPLPGDEILDALVACGPWDAIGTRCRWRAKIQPGSTKKGKAVREILATWTRVIADREKKKRPGAGEGNEVMMQEEKIRAREGQLLQGIREVEVVGVIPVSKLRVVMGVEGSTSRGKGGGGPAKRGGRGSKKQR
ncbi:MAG: hypothetical protein Q9166_005592 [cf. Caloplaca sp. 2 TL-2023]